jgi:protein O-mannosyl-transferase
LLEQRLGEGRASNHGRFFTESYWGDLQQSGLYRPFSLACLSVQRSAFGTNPAPYRLVSLLLHAICCLLVFALLLRLLPLAGAFAGALLFAAHPIHAEAVTTIYGQQDLLGALFGLAAVLAATAPQSTRVIGVPVVVGGCCWLLSLLSKEQGILLPLFFPILRMGQRRWDRRNITFSGRELAMAVPLGCYLLLRLQALGPDVVPTGAASVAHGYPLWARVNLVIVSVGTYLRLLVIPWGQTTYYGHLRDSLFGVPTIEALTVLGAFLLLGILQRSLGRRVVLQASALLLLTLLPVANLLPIGVVVAERCLYLPVAAVSVLAGAAYLATSRIRPRVAVGAVCAIVLAGVMLSGRVAARWRTPLRHWETTASDHPRSAAAHARVALLQLYAVEQEAGPPDLPTLQRIEDSIDRALSINERQPDGWHARGRLALLRRDCSAAVRALRRALALRPGDKEIAALLMRCR